MPQLSYAVRIAPKRSGQQDRIHNDSSGGCNVNPFKLLGWAGIAIAVIGAFVDIPYAPAILVILGLIGGYAVATEDTVRVLVTALVLAGLSGQFLQIPNIGEYLTHIFSNYGNVVGGASFTLITRNVWRRFKP